MKKTLLSILAGLMVIGSASAVPTPEDRRALCEKHPDKYVWVEKDEFCAPINPCLENTIASVKDAYCLNAVVPSDIEKRNLVIERYTTKVLGTSSRHIFPVPGTDLKTWSYVGVKTYDGRYFVLKQVLDNSVPESLVAVLSAFGAYGYFVSDIKVLEADGNGKAGIQVALPSGPKCDDIKDFASLLLGDLVEQDTTQANCTLICSISAATTIGKYAKQR